MAGEWAWLQIDQCISARFIVSLCSIWMGLSKNLSFKIAMSGQAGSFGHGAVGQVDTPGEPFD